MNPNPAAALFRRRHGSKTRSASNGGGGGSRVALLHAHNRFTGALERKDGPEGRCTALIERSGCRGVLLRVTALLPMCSRENRETPNVPLGSDTAPYPAGVIWTRTRGEGLLKIRLLAGLPPGSRSYPTVLRSALRIRLTAANDFVTGIHQNLGSAPCQERP